MPLSTKRLRASKSESARSLEMLWKSWICGLLLPTELLSIDFETVSEPDTVRPLDSRLWASQNPCESYVRILIAEDSLTQAVDLRRRLEALGHEVVVTAAGNCRSRARFGAGA